MKNHVTHIIGIPYSLGAPKRSAGAEKFPAELKNHMSRFSFRKRSQGGLPALYEFLSLHGSKKQTKALEIAKKKLLNSLKNNVPTCIIGGDNSIVYFAFTAFSEVMGKKGISPKSTYCVSFDRHPDVMSPARRDRVPHATWLRHLLEEKKVSPDNVLLLGIGDAEEEELDYIKEKKISCLNMRQLHDAIYEKREKVFDGFFKNAKNRSHANKAPRAICISIDVDVLDPAFLPGTGTPRAGGLSTQELLCCIQYLKNTIGKNTTLVWAITEAIHNQKTDQNRLTLMAVESLVLEVVAQRKI